MGRSVRETVRAGWRELVAGLGTLSRAHRIWYVVATAVYWLFLILFPPFQTNDEDAHWMRMWTVASGGLTCNRLIPATAFDLINTSHYYQVRIEGKKYQFALIDDQLAFHGRGLEMAPLGSPCMYMPLSYLAPALVVRLVANPYDPARPSHMLQAFYAARITNLIMMVSAVLIFLAFVPQLRNLTLLLYSLPMMIQQGISINQESTIMLLFLMLMIFWWRRSSTTGAVIMSGLITLLSIAKPVYLVLYLLWFCYLIRIRRRESKSFRWLLSMSSLVLIPIAIWLLWTHFVIAEINAKLYLASWVDMPAQVQFLKSHPLMLLRIVFHQLMDLFGREHMRGGWISVFGVLGWADFEIGNRAYYSLLLATLLAVISDFGTPSKVRSPEAEPQFERVIPFIAFFLIIPAIAIAMYVQFTTPGFEFAIGTSGRYLHIPYFGMIAFGLETLRSRSGSRWQRIGRVLPWVTMFLCGIGVYDAIGAILARFYA